MYNKRMNPHFVRRDIYSLAQLILRKYSQQVAILYTKRYILRKVR